MSNHLERIQNNIPLMQGKSRVRPGREQTACSQYFSVPSVQLGASSTLLRTPEYLQSRAGPLRLAHLHSSPCMTPDKHRNTEQHGPGEFKLLIKLNYSWKQFFYFFFRLSAEAAGQGKSAAPAGFNCEAVIVEQGYRRAWCQGVCPASRPYLGTRAAFSSLPTREAKTLLEAESKASGA